MEEVGVESPEVKSFFLYKKFEELCPYFISIGMTYDQFWRDDVSIAKYYLEAYEMKIKRDIEFANWCNHNQGMYNYEAFCYVSPVMHAFSKKGTKPLPFPNKPHELFGKEEKVKSQEEIMQEQENERLKATLFFSNWVKGVSKKFEGK